jgi:choline dehydrogenase
MCNIKFVILLLVIVLVVDNVKGSDDEESNEKTSDNTYDYIVVGVGQAGSVAAARLAESGKYKVLGIEAGERTHRSLNGTDYVAADYIVDSKGKVKIGKPWTRFDVPAFTGSITSEVPTPYPEWTAYFNGVAQPMGIGRLLGGSGAHNGMIWSRHTKATIDSWGIKGWSYEEVLPFYKKSENVSASTTASDRKYHGLKGPIQVSDTPSNSLYSAVPLLVQSCEALGYPYNPDFNGASRYGCGEQVYDIGDGVRYSAANGYLPSAMKKGNLRLSLGSHATRILIKAGAKKGSKPVAYGVEYVQDGKTKVAYAEKEIVVSMSAVFTPQLLMLSGIGPASDLKALKIPVWVDNANVGKGILSNQLTLGANEYPCAPFGSAFRVSDYASAYALNRTTSPWAHAGQFAYAYLCSKSGTTCDNPDVMIGFQAGGFFGNIASTGAPVPTLVTQVTNTKSHAHGTIRLLSNDPFALLNVTIDTWAHPEDLKVQIFGWRTIRKILGTSPASTIIGPEVSPGAKYQSDAELADWILSINSNAYNVHWVGSAIMGNEGSTTRVTDPEMRVVGIDGLRIGDTSVLYSVNSHLQASAAMCGERVADFILNH